ncbi:kinase-interacting family protein-like [Typha latifolia]|uniref:kinase-interacting family protein-like n=1 Tax=Typha latifolia TaxID=4733 RepID=UPI003C2B3917
MATTDTTTIPASCHHPCRSFTCPPWLQAALADIEQRVRTLAVSLPDEEDSDSFAERAENYYQKRPQLISLLIDLHHRYLYLADRYTQSLKASSHRRRISSVPSESDEGDGDGDLTSASDAESSLSFQPAPIRRDPGPDPDLIVAELVVTFVERDILASEAVEAERRRSEYLRKIELQGSLVEVLESERMVLLGENAKLGFRVEAAEEGAAAMAVDLGRARRRAAEMARLVVRLREEHRVCVLGRRIEGLQAQIYRLERRNRECFEAMKAREEEKARERDEVERLRRENRRLAEAAARRKGKWRWWSGSGRMMEWDTCGKGGKGGGCFGFVG